MQLTADELTAMLLKARAAAHRDAAQMIETSLLDNGLALPIDTSGTDAVRMVVSMLRRAAAPNGLTRAQQKFNEALSNFSQAPGNIRSEGEH